MTIFMVLSSRLRATTKVQPVHLMNADSALDGYQPSDQAKQLVLWVRRQAATILIHHRHCIITQPESWYSFYRLAKGRRLCWPRHCSKAVQPVPKAVYRSGRHDKHSRSRWDSNLGPFTRQSDALTTRPLRHAVFLKDIDTNAVYFTAVFHCVCVMIALTSFWRCFVCFYW